MPDRAVPEHGPRTRRRLGGAPRALRRQDARQQLEWKRLDVDFLHADILTSIWIRSHRIVKNGRHLRRDVTLGPIRIDGGIETITVEP
jgi:hypothetical protein